MITYAFAYLVYTLGIFVVSMFCLDFTMMFSGGVGRPVEPASQLEDYPENGCLELDNEYDCPVCHGDRSVSEAGWDYFPCPMECAE